MYYMYNIYKAPTILCWTFMKVKFLVLFYYLFYCSLCLVSVLKPNTFFLQVIVADFLRQAIN